MPYDDPNTKIENFLKEWLGFVWKILKWFGGLAFETFRQGSWVFKDAIPKERGRRRY